MNKNNINSSQRFIKMFTLSCILISSIFFFFGWYVLYKNRDYEMANHSFLFATSTEGFLLRNSLLLSIIGSLPLILPILFKRNVFNIVIALISAALFFFLQYVLFILAD